MKSNIFIIENFDIFIVEISVLSIVIMNNMLMIIIVMITIIAHFCGHFISIIIVIANLQTIVNQKSNDYPIISTKIIPLKIRLQSIQEIITRISKLYRNAS